MSRTRLLRLLAIVLFVALIPIVLIATNVRWVINAPILYSYGFDKYDSIAWTCLQTCIERGELLLAGKQIRDYFNNDQEFLDVRVAVGGIRQSIYDESEVLHMRDVKGLVRGVYRTQEIAAFYLVAFAVIGFLLGKRPFLPQLGKYMSVGGLLTVGLVLVAGLGSLVGFDRLFLAFHLVSFSNDLWLLDPRSDYLIAMFPLGFFFEATMWIALSTIGQALVLVSLPPAVRGWRARREKGEPAASTAFL